MFRIVIFQKIEIVIQRLDLRITRPFEDTDLDPESFIVMVLCF